jgi:exopolyphosphatase/guanosine-5'-triphosphate,3'-diphosphate pyrophosphatase
MAAVDLGSNSFHMIVARLQHGQLVVIDRLREMVRLASGLRADGTLDPASESRALQCLQRFGERIRTMHAERVRVVGTNTLRRTRNSQAFLAAAEAALGHPVEVIAGIEEARLIYQGVAHSLPAADGRTLVVDIGGGSTELIVGQGFEPERLESLFMGCVGISQRFFDEKLTAKRFDRARLAVRLELRPIEHSFRGWGWEQAVGSSGTIRAAARVAEALGLAEGGLDAAALEAIIARIIDMKKVARLSLPGLDSERAPVFAGGVAILVEVMETLGITRLGVSDGALREGLLYDMIGRLSHEDARERTVRAMRARYHVDPAQAGRVAATAERLLSGVAQAWGLTDERYSQALQWSAQLHEIGLDIAHTKYHQHGAYLLRNADLPGFGRKEQLLLATLVGGHRRKLSDLSFADLSEGQRQPALKLLVLLRLAALLERSRTDTQLPPLELRASHQSLEILFPPDWLEANRLTLADLEQEKSFLAEVGFDLRIVSGI